MKRSSEAKRVLDELDAELASNVARAGRSLGWSAAERQILAMVADSIDRAVELTAAYRQAGDVKDKLKLSRELRLQRRRRNPVPACAGVRGALPVPPTA